MTKCSWGICSDQEQSFTNDNSCEHSVSLRCLVFRNDFRDRENEAPELDELLSQGDTVKKAELEFETRRSRARVYVRLRYAGSPTSPHLRGTVTSVRQSNVHS